MNVGENNFIAFKYPFLENLGSPQISGEMR